MVASLKHKAIDGKAPPGVEPAACSQPSGTPLEESAAWNDQCWMWPSQLWLVANSPSVTSSGRGTEKTGLPWTHSWKPSLRAKTGCAGLNFGGASAVSCRGARLVAQQSGTLCRGGWRATPSFSSDATYGKLLEHPAHAQPSQVVVVVPTDFGFDGRKDRDGISQEAVLQCFQERRRTVKVDLVSEDTLPQFRFRCHTPCSILPAKCRTGTCAVLQVVLLPPQRRSRSPHRNFIVDVSDSDDEFGLPYWRLSPSSSDAVHLRRPYTKRERSNE